MSVSSFNETLIRGDINEFEVNVDADGVDITNMLVIMTAKRHLRDSIDDAIFQISTDTGDIIIEVGPADPVTGKSTIGISIPPESTENITISTLLYADLQIIDGSNKPRTPLIGTFKVVLDVTDGLVS